MTYTIRHSDFKMVVCCNDYKQAKAQFDAQVRFLEKGQSLKLLDGLGEDANILEECER